VLLAIAVLLLVLRVVLGLRAAHTGGAAAGPVGDVDRVRWRTLASAVEEARVTRKPLLYDFSADWCGPCRRMQREIFADPQAAADLEARFVPVRVLDRTREEGHNPAWVDSLEARFAVNAFPTLIVERAGARPLRIEGYMGRDFTLGRIHAAGSHVGWQLSVPGPGGSPPPAASAGR
jgi:thiol:disulfide interchange protein